jgi:N-acetylmuramoyl-L-alanine amidase
VTDGAEGENLTFEAALALQKTQLWNLALEIHNNAHIGPARGVEVVSPSKAFDLFSRDLASSVAAAMGTLVRHPYSGGVIRQQQTARGRLGWVRQGGVLLEAGFITHPQDRAALIERPVEIGEAIAAAIFRFVLPPK